MTAVHSSVAASTWTVPLTGGRPSGACALLACAAVSLVLHCLVLGIRTAPAPIKPGGSVNAGASSVQVRLRPLVPALPQATPNARSAGLISMATSHADPAKESALPPRAKVSAEPDLTQSPGAKDASTSDISVVQRSATETSLDAAGDYVPRPLLSVAPLSKAPIILNTPPEVEAGGTRVQGVLALFIDEEGVVQGIEAQEPHLPSAFERAARDAFMAARFSPGELNGRAVKSRIRVEVVFDSTPTVDR